MTGTPEYPYTEFTGTADTTNTGGLQSVDTVVPAFAAARAADAASTAPEGMPYGITQNAEGVFVPVVADVNGKFILDGVVYETSAQKAAAGGA